MTGFHCDAEQVCDVLIIGGGIAGVSIAERLAREAMRKGKKLRIILAEREQKLATGASGGLEGWLHTGVLYTKLENPRTFTNCMNALEDLVNWYALDTAFDHHSHCNLRLPTAGKGRPRRVPDTDGWFENELHFEFDPSADSSCFAAERDRVQNVAPAVFLESDWRDPRLGVARAPHLAPARNDSPSRSHRNNREDPHTLPTDMTMRTGRILGDLASAAAKLGVEFLLGYEARHTGETQSNARVTELCPTKGDSPTLRVSASQVVYANGCSLNQDLTTDLGLVRDIRFTHRTSVMVVVSPALPSHSFARLGAHKENDLNHVIRESESGSISILADSNYAPPDASSDDLGHAAQAIMDKAVSYFEDVNWADHKFGWYACSKVECSLSDGVSDDYSFWWGPTTLHQTDQAWQDLRVNDKGQAEQSVLDWVLSRDAAELPAPIKSDWWAIRKAIHFAALSQISLTTMPDGDRVAQVVQSLASSSQHSSTRNAMFVVPGKFSLFPSVAHQAYIEMEIRGLYDDLETGNAPCRVFDRSLVSTPAAILAAQDASAAQLKQWTKDDSQCV